MNYKQVPFWKKKWDGKICCITQTRLRPGKNKYGMSHSVFLKCSHGFYRSVLIEWIKNCPTIIPTCPVCRQLIDGM
jgi:hypothetical protein